MDLSLDEQRLLAEFRRLSADGKRELIDYATFLNKKHGHATPTEETPKNQCSLGTPKEARPEAAKEPIVTE